jgi:hypothetical protein
LTAEDSGDPSRHPDAGLAIGSPWCDRLSPPDLITITKIKTRSHCGGIDAILQEPRILNGQHCDLCMINKL